MFLTTFSIRNAFGAASCFLAALACGSSESTGPSTGSVEVVATTTGADLDPDGYAVAVDGGGGLSLPVNGTRSEEHTSELQSQSNLVCRLLLEKNNNNSHRPASTPTPFPIILDFTLP